MQVLSDGQSQTLMKSFHSRFAGHCLRNGRPSCVHCQKVLQLSGLGYRHWLITQSSSGQVKVSRENGTAVGELQN